MGLFNFFNKKEKNNIVREEKVEKITLTEDEAKVIFEEIKNETKRTSYKINAIEKTNLTIFDSKFGGLPYWDKNLEYPKTDDGKDMILLAQINFEKEKFNNENLPKEGLLQFFISQDDSFGLFEKNGYAVFYHKEINKEISIEDIKELNIKTCTEVEFFPIEKELALEFEKREETISPLSETEYTKLVKEKAKEKYNKEINVPIYDIFDEENYNELCENVSGSKILGYPYYTQMEPGFAIDNLLLLQIDSGKNIMWGDFGVANFFIVEEDLKKKDFSNVLYNWDCG